MRKILLRSMQRSEVGGASGQEISFAFGADADFAEVFPELLKKPKRGVGLRIAKIPDH
jgi:hypothetical protein